MVWHRSRRCPASSGQTPTAPAPAWCRSWRLAPGMRERLPAGPPSLKASVAWRLPPARDDLARPRLLHRAHRHLAAIREVDHRIENDLIACLDAFMPLDLGAEVARNGDLLQMGDAVLHHRDVQAVVVEHLGVGRYDHRWRLARNIELDGAIDSGAERAVRIGNVDFGQQRPAA